jgi:hypothetical protein
MKARIAPYSGRDSSSALFNNLHNSLMEEPRSSGSYPCLSSVFIRGYGVAVVAGRFQASLAGTASGKVPSGLTLALTMVLPEPIAYT